VRKLENNSLDKKEGKEIEVRYKDMFLDFKP